MEQEKIGNFIKDIRKKNNLTQKQLADKLGVTFQAVSKWENGKNIPDIAILKDISTLFNVNIDDILSGEGNKKNNNKKMYYIFILVVIVLVGTIILSIIFNDSHDFEFKQISTSCDNFNITGIMAYNKDKTSLYISSVEFCGSDEDIIYKNIGCTLYESHNGDDHEISTCDIDNDVTLKEYLKDIKISVDDYKPTCLDTASSELYLEINATVYDNKEIVYKIPITLMDNSCKN